MYKFPLESLRKYRKRKEELYQKDLYECDRELNKESKKLDVLHYKKYSASKRSRNIRISGFKPSDSLLFERYFMNLNLKIDYQNKKLEEKKEKKRSATDKLLGAVKKRKMVEKLKEYRYSEFKKTEEKKFQVESDEAAVQSFRKKQDGR